MKIFYGTDEIFIDVTITCFKQMMINNIIIIPSNDLIRARYFSDPVIGKIKKIFIQDEEKNRIEYDDKKSIKINILNNEISVINNDDVNDLLLNIQSGLKIKYGSFQEELPEQKMVVRYLTGNEKVLEIGGNIGRNSLIISNILSKKNNNDFVVLECDQDIANQLKENRDLNQMNFYIENSALSNRKLIQKGWDTIVSDELLDGYKWVNTIKLDELKNKYNIHFDTLVLDCEGAFYYILLDMPEILNNIQLIIMENDYHELHKKQYIDEILIQNGFYLDYQEGGGWGCCHYCFFQVWKK